MITHFRFVRDHHKRVKKVAVVTNSHIGDVAERLASHFVSRRSSGTSPVSKSSKHDSGLTAGSSTGSRDLNYGLGRDFSPYRGIPNV